MMPTPMPSSTYVLITSESSAVSTTLGSRPLAANAALIAERPVKLKSYVTMGNLASASSGQRLASSRADAAWA